ncbi:hypothetical protein ABMY26_19515 [Azospirillum sp. HJ39]|uniref:hypothetical protein n=1 Tax=Azospirillum sp. HJ39 TaxID=3159496 RepID=UPI0035561CEB
MLEKTGTSLSSRGPLAAILGGLMIGWAAVAMATTVEDGFVATSSDQQVKVQRVSGGTVEEIPANSMFRVRQGDIIRASTRTTVRIAVLSDREDDVTIEPHRPFPVQGKGVPSTVPDNMLRFVVDWFRTASMPQPAPTVTRFSADDIVAPVKWRASNHLAAGGTALAFAWANLAEPVDLILLSDQNRTLAKSIGVTGGKAELRNGEGAFEAGRLYRLKLKWKGGERNIEIKAVSPGAVPVHNKEAPVNPIDKTLRGIVDAVQLAAVDNGVWTLEAYQRLSALNSPTASMAAKLLVEGKAPPASPQQ